MYVTEIDEDLIMLDCIYKNVRTLKYHIVNIYILYISGVGLWTMTWFFITSYAHRNIILYSNLVIDIPGSENNCIYSLLLITLFETYSKVHIISVLEYALQDLTVWKNILQAQIVKFHINWLQKFI